MAWSDRVSAAIVGQVSDALGDRAAIIGTKDDPGFISRFVFGDERVLADGRPEALVSSSELPPDRRKAPATVDPDELVDAIAAEPGIGRAALADTFGVHRDTVAKVAGQLEAAGRIRALRNGHGFSYWPASGASEEAAS
jgi:hypothetical protein